jgi:NTP pyrophosphatase (non-canonical NTP hydrolase)
MTKIQLLEGFLISLTNNIVDILCTKAGSGSYKIPREFYGMGMIYMEELIKKIILFRDERDWKQFHTPENLAKSICIEAAELLENFQWGENFSMDKVVEELADVMMYCVLMADSLSVDIVKTMEDKLNKNSLKYPVEKAKGNSKKYTEF